MGFSGTKFSGSPGGGTVNTGDGGDLDPFYIGSTASATGLYQTGDSRALIERFISGVNDGATYVASQGTGNLAAVNLAPNGSGTWRATGETGLPFKPTNNNTYDIGQAGAQVRSLYLGTTLVTTGSTPFEVADDTSAATTLSGKRIPVTVTGDGTAYFIRLYSA